MSNPERLVEAANALIQMSSPEEIITILRKYPELLSNEINAIFENGIEHARQQGDLEFVEVAEQRYQSLQKIKQLQYDSNFSCFI
jgi:hypothetical protein